MTGNSYHWTVILWHAKYLLNSYFNNKWYQSLAWLSSALPVINISLASIRIYPSWNKNTTKCVMTCWLLLNQSVKFWLTIPKSICFLLHLWMCYKHSLVFRPATSKNSPLSYATLPQTSTEGFNLNKAWDCFFQLTQNGNFNQNVHGLLMHLCAM